MGLFQSFKEICGKVHFRQKNCDYSFHMFLEIDLYDFSYSHLKWICEKMCQKIFSLSWYFVTSSFLIWINISFGYLHVTNRIIKDQFRNS